MKMKLFFRITVILFVANIHNCAIAQTSIYHPFPDSCAYWTVDEFDSSFPGVTSLSAFEIYMNGDTTCNGLTYHKLMVTGDWNYNTTHGYGTYLFGILWQDTLLKRVYFRDKYSVSCSTCDSLLYNFNLHAGDSVMNNLDFMPTFQMMLIHSVDSININGSYRKRYIISDLGHNINGVQIIEGIGSTLGGFYQYDYFEQYYRLNCFNMDSTFLYTYPGITCAPLIAHFNSGTDYSNELVTFPSPVKNEFHIQCPHKIDRVELVDIFGINHQGISYHTSTSGLDVNLTASFPDGIYILKIWIEGVVYSKTIVILNN